MADQPVRLCIVSRDGLHGGAVLAALEPSLRPHEHLAIIVDRRRGRPSDEWAPAEDRRRRPQVDLALKANGFAVVPAESPKRDRTPLSLLLPSASSRSAFDDGSDDEERLEAIRNFKRARSRNLVPWLVAALAVVAAAFVLSPTGHAFRQSVARRIWSDTRGSSSPGNVQHPDVAVAAREPALGGQPGVAEAPAQADAPSRADVPARVDAPARVLASGTPPVGRPLQHSASSGTVGGEHAPSRDTGSAASTREPGARSADTGVPSRATTAPATGKRSRSTETGRPTASTPVLRQAAAAPGPAEPASRAVSPRFAGLPRVALSQESGAGSTVYLARIVDPAGRPLPNADVLLLARMPDGTVENVRMDYLPERGAYRGSLVTTHSSPVDLRVRVILGDKRVEIPLAP